MKRDVALLIEGSLLERLLQQASEQGAQFAQLRRVSARGIRVYADEESARLLLNLCRRYGLNCRVLSRGGFSALKRSLRARWTLLIGLALCALLCHGALSRLWWIDVSFLGSAAQPGSEAQLRACLKEEGVAPGMALSKIDSSLLQKQLMAKAGDFSFVGVRRQGVRLHVEAACEQPSPEVYHIEYARDLVAARDGVIVALNVKSGRAAVKIGDTVRRGQVLIRGEEAAGRDGESGEEITVGVSALGEAIARCWYEGSAEGALDEEIHLPSGRVRESRSLRLLNWRIDLSACESFPLERVEQERLPAVGLFLPIEIEKSVHRELRAQRREISPEALAEGLRALAQAEAKAKLPEGCAFTGWEERTQTQSTLRIRAVYEVQTNIAVSREALRGSD